MVVLDVLRYSFANFQAMTTAYIFHKQLWWSGQGPLPSWYDHAYLTEDSKEQNSAASSSAAPTAAPAPSEDLMTMAMALAKSVLGRT